MAFDPYPGQNEHLRNVPIALLCIALVLTGARLVTTWKNRGWFGLEDFFIIASVLCLVALCIVTVESANYGFGKHVIDIKKSGGNLDKAFMFYYLAQIVYRVNINLNKLSFLLLYYRIFAVPLFRRICLLMIGIISASAIAFTVATVFQCTPIDKVWHKNKPGHCVNLPWFRWTWSSWNLFTDILIFMFPLPVISRLHMSWSKKFGLGFVFVIGFFICLTTALRMTTINRAAHAKEQTWESCATLLWSFIETSVGVICACLISLRKILTICSPERSYKSKNSKYGPYGSGVNSGSKRAGPSPGSQRLDDCDEPGYRLESASTFSRNNGTTYDPDGKHLGAGNVTVMSGNGSNESQEHIIDPNRGITVKKEIKVRSERHRV